MLTICYFMQSFKIMTFAFYTKNYIFTNLFYDILNLLR